MNPRLLLLAPAFAVSTLAVAQDQTILEIIQGSPNHTTLEQLVIDAGLAETVMGLDGASVFAPTDDAFAALDAELLAGLQADQAALQQALLYHVIGTSFDDGDEDEANDFPALAFFASLDNNGNSVQLYTADDGEDEDEDADVFVNGGYQATVIPASNGTVLSIDSVLLARTVGRIVTESPVHETLETAIFTAGLGDDLGDTATMYTVFAPTDDAFEALPEGTVASLLADTATLANILRYHYVTGQVLSAEDIVAAAPVSVTTAQGDSVDVTIVDGGVVLDGTARVIIADIKGTDGVVHVIDGILMPSDTSSSVKTLSAAAAGISVFPVPASGATTVSLPAALASGTDLRIIDVRGAEVARQALRGASTSVDVSALRAGSYYFLFDAADGRSFVQQVSVR